MNNTLSRSVLAGLLLTSLLSAQEGYDNSPAPQLKKFEPLIGSWQGKGTMVEPTGATSNWTGRGTYRWCLGKHFVQEDMSFQFEGSEQPIVFRSYFGWDKENGRYVAVAIGSDGTARLNDVTLLPDGTMMQLIKHVHEGVPMIERARMKLDGDSMAMQIDMLMAEGASLTMVEATMTRSDVAFDGAPATKGWMGVKPNEHMQRLGKAAGSYDVKGDLVMFPGQPPMKITGTDRYTKMYDGTVVHAYTEGFAEGAPDKYESHAFHAWDGDRKCIRTVFVSNMGEVGEMEARFVGEHMISTAAAVAMGQPTTQRFVMTFAADGSFASGKGHTCMGTIDPFVSFVATYAKK